MVNQLTINIGFYMLMPYLAGHLANGLGMAAWTVGLILGSGAAGAGTRQRRPERWC
jgi:hypothetical protein